MRKVNYKTRIETIPIKGIKVKLHHITNIEELFNEMMKKDSSSIEMKDERIPYWTELWPSAIALSEFIVEHKVVNEKTSVHEIGCGLSLPGIVCGKLGADVLLSDYLPEPLEVAAKNWQLNVASSPKTMLMDWRKPIAEKCDVLLAADVAYEKRMFGTLVKAFSALIKSDGKILFSEPDRELTLPFYDLLKINGFKISTTKKVVRINDFGHSINVSVIRKI